MSDESSENPVDDAAWRSAFEASHYGVIRQAISQDTVGIAARYMRMLYEHHQPLLVFNERQQSYGAYGDPLGESILATVLPQICGLTGLELLPTYSYSRIYSKGGILDRHIDRPSCEVSGTLLIDSDAEWPIYLEVDGQAREVLLAPGDLMIYRGCDLPHWRDSCPCEFSAHVFLHFVEAGGPYAHLVYDERTGLGAMQTKVRPLRDPYLDRAEQARRHKPMPRVRRNEPCPCGSGKKFKLCHGAIATDPTQR
ncbi:MAG: SEC-C domain-containing protein [Gammaproteobacteria bacterium]|nr:SEC-C domain-containing protein [Gammaproteobacteria bacterium]